MACEFGDDLSVPHGVLYAECQSLKARVAQLEHDLRQANASLEMVRQTPRLAQGKQAELYIANLVGGTLMHAGSSYDVFVNVNGKTLEVKEARLYRPNKHRDSTRWTWAKAFGEQGGKYYDNLVLIGEKDHRYIHCYKDKTGPYVIFNVPFNEVQSLTCKAKGAQRQIWLSSNPQGIRGTKAKDLFYRFQVTESELRSACMRGATVNQPSSEQQTSLW